MPRSRSRCWASPGLRRKKASLHTGKKESRTFHPSLKIFRLQIDLVDVAPRPFMVGEGPHDRMSALLEVGGGVPAGCGIAAADGTARLAHAQLDPFLP